MKKAIRYLTIVVLISAGLFSIWFRFFVDENNEFKNSTIFEHHQGISTDGPHILYTGDSVRMIRVIKKGKDFEIVDDYSLLNKAANSFEVSSFTIGDNQPVSFNVVLSDSLVTPPSTYSEPDSILVISDIEGNFYAFHKLLIANNVIDANCNWTFGKGHLVLLGDFVDRGLNVTQCLWLAYKLEQQARGQGGNVHFVIGNHEILNLKDKLFHVRSKYKKLARHFGLNYSNDFYGSQSELGKWLRTKNGMIKIGDLLFAHAGISREFLDLKLSFDRVNQIVRDNIDTESTDSTSMIVNGLHGPYWTRKMGHDINEETEDLLEDAKQFYDFSTLIIGHSTMPDIYEQYDGSLINVDIHFPHKNTDLKRGKALFIVSGIRYIVDDLGNKTKIRTN